MDTHSGLALALTGALVHAAIHTLNKSESKLAFGIANSVDFIFIVCSLPRASTALVLPVTAFRQVAKVVLGWMLLREMPTRRHLMASLLVSGGVFLSVLTGPHEKHAVEGLSHFLGLIWAPHFMFWSALVLLVVLICIHISFFAPSRESAVILPPESRRGIRWLFKMPVGWTAKRGALATCAGVSAGLSFCLWEIVVDIFLSNGISAAYDNFRMPLLVAWLTFLHIASMVLFILALERFDTSIVMPIYTVACIITGVVSNLAVFQSESRSPFTDSILNQIWFLVGIFMTCAGLVTSSKADTAREMDELKQVARDFLRVTNADGLFADSVDAEVYGNATVEDSLAILMNELEASNVRSPQSEEVDHEFIDNLLKEVEDEALNNLEMGKVSQSP